MVLTRREKQLEMSDKDRAKTHLAHLHFEYVSTTAMFNCKFQNMVLLFMNEPHVWMREFWLSA